MRWPVGRTICPLCNGVKERLVIVCPFCRQKIENFQYHNPLFAGDFRLYRVASYREFRKVHLRFKYGGQTQLARVMAMLMLQSYLGSLPDAVEAADVIVYVPSTRVRLGQRGYNTSELLARWLGKYMDKPVRALLKRKNGPKQTGLDEGERLKNVQGIFSINKRIHTKCIKFGDPSILLLDDVCTSGATMAEAVRTLVNHGYVNVAGLCFLSKR